MQLTSLSDVTKENLIFNDPVKQKVKSCGAEYERIKIQTKYPDNKKGPLIIESPFLSALE